MLFIQMIPLIFGDSIHPYVFSFLSEFLSSSMVSYVSFSVNFVLICSIFSLLVIIRGWQWSDLACVIGTARVRNNTNGFTHMKISHVKFVYSSLCKFYEIYGKWDIKVMLIRLYEILRGFILCDFVIGVAQEFPLHYFKISMVLAWMSRIPPHFLCNFLFVYTF